MDQDIEFIASSCHMEKIFSKKVILNSSPNLPKKSYVNKSDNTTADISKSNSISYKKYFNELSDSLIEKLYKIYKADFVIFDYSANL